MKELNLKMLRSKDTRVCNTELEFPVWAIAEATIKPDAGESLGQGYSEATIIPDARRNVQREVHSRLTSIRAIAEATINHTRSEWTFWS